MLGNNSSKLLETKTEGILTISYFLIITTLIVTVMISSPDKPYQLEHKEVGDSISSNVWCTSKWGMKTCRFSNLYYNHMYGFMFLLTNSSTISGLDSYCDMTSLKLSPIDGHSLVNMHLTTVRDMDVLGEPIKYIRGSYFMIYKFKPDNLMHVIHDDLLPLYIKYKEICLGNVTDCSTKFHLLFADPYMESPFMHWYRVLSSKEPFSTNELSNEFTFCISSITLGVANSTFFQYGFKKPQGPIRTKLIKSDLQEFRNYFLNYFGITTTATSKKCCVVTLISRSINRKIINEAYVSQVFATAVQDGLKTSEFIFHKIDMLLNSTENILSTIVSTDILVAVHGAETVLSLFLTDQSIFIELFPFGIVRENVSPIASLSSITGIHFNYLSWTNLKEENSVLHPEYPSQFGGTDGLPLHVVQDIYATKNVSAVECCDNPYYLFRMYQDTIIDDSFQHVAISAIHVLKFERNKIVDSTSQWFYPGPVGDLKCIFYPNLIFITWLVPFNLLNVTAVYNVIVRGGTNHYNITTKKTELYLEFSHVSIEKVEVWVSCLVNQRTSVDSFCECEINHS